MPYTPTTPIRTYVIDNAGHGYNSLYAMFQMPGINGAWWGIQETGFADAPILENPTTTRKLDGRTYRFYFNGPHLHSSRSPTESASTGSSTRCSTT